MSIACCVPRSILKPPPCNHFPDAWYILYRGGLTCGALSTCLLTLCQLVQKPAYLRPVAQVPRNSAQVSLILSVAPVIELCFGTWILISDCLLRRRTPTYSGFPFLPSSPGVPISSLHCRSPRPQSCFLLLPFHPAAGLLSSEGRRAEAPAWRRREAGGTGARSGAVEERGARRGGVARRSAAWPGRWAGEWRARARPASPWRAPGGRGRSVLAPAASSPHLWVGSAAWGRLFQDGGGLLRGEEAETVQFAPLWLGWRWWRLLLLPLQRREPVPSRRAGTRRRRYAAQRAGRAQRRR